MFEYTRLIYQIMDKIWWRKILVMYLYPPPFDMRRMQDILTKGLDPAFGKVVTQHLKAYMTAGVAPPAAIESTIMNFADDMVAGRPVSVRTGDYIAVQNFIQGMKGKKK